MGEDERALEKLKMLLSEHLEVESKISKITESPTFDQLLVQRLKKQKLQLKDKISDLKEFLCDDIIA